jgi:hypothetical protein
MKPYIFGVVSIIVPLLVLYLALGEIGWLLAGLIATMAGFYLGITGKVGIKEAVFLSATALILFLSFEAILGFFAVQLPAVLLIKQFSVLDAFLFFIGGLIASVIYPYVKK